MNDFQPSNCVETLFAHLPLVEGMILVREKIDSPPNNVLTPEQ